jgi:putative ABC transport system permease protein
MKTLRRLFKQFFSWRTAQQAEEILQSEIEEHIALQTAENLRAGMPPMEARREALLKFGNVEAIKELYRDQRGLPFMETFLSDARHVLRRLRKAPAFTAAVIFTLALGIGANTAIFGVVDSILIRPLPYPHAEALMGVWQTAPGLPPPFTGNLSCSPSMYFTYSEENRTFQQFGLWSSNGVGVTGIAEPEVAKTLLVTYGVLDALAVPPLMGRWLSQADDTPGSPRTVILTYGYWQRRFAGDKSILGRTLTISSEPTTVIGVMPEDFRFQNDPEIILPQRFDRSTVALGSFAYKGIARLKPGVSLKQANADLSHMLGIWLNAWPVPPGLDISLFRNARMGPDIRPLSQEIVGDIGATLWVVMGTLGLVLLIVCANIANLLLVRADGRQQELAIRAALGAGRGRIAREMLVESMTLGILGGTLGLGLAYAALRTLVAVGPGTLPRLKEIGVDWRVFAFALGISMLSGLLFGLIPILKYAGPRVANSLRGIGRTFSQGRERHRARNALVVVQMALAVVLLICSGLMIRTFQHLLDVQPGFTHPEEVHILHAIMPPSVTNQPERLMHMHNEILDKLAAIPGVISVGFADTAPLETIFGEQSNVLFAEDKTFPTPHIAKMRKIGPGFFHTMGTRIVAGRDLTWADLYDKRHVAMVSENLAKEWWGDTNSALGKRIRENPKDPWREIVGVTADVYDKGVQTAAPKFAYWPALVDHYTWVGGGPNAVTNGMYAIRTNSTATEALLAQARQAIWSVNGRQPLFLVTTLKTLYDQSMVRTSFMLVILAIAGGMALILGIVGIYGVIAYTVSQRTREIGICMALGAQPERLSRMFVRHGLLLAAIGAGLGVAASAMLTRLMSSLLFGVTPLDPVTYAAVLALLLLVSILASYFPARRAMAIDPVQALRAE